MAGGISILDAEVPRLYVDGHGAIDEAATAMTGVFERGSFRGAAGMLWYDEGIFDPGSAALIP